MYSVMDAGFQAARCRRRHEKQGQPRTWIVTRMWLLGRLRRCLKGFYYSGVIGNEWYSIGSEYNKDIKDELLRTSWVLLCSSGIYFNGGT